jgi:hypothetical protein
VYEKCEFLKKTHTLGPNDVSGIVWALVSIRLACVSCRWPSVAFVWPVGAKTGGLYVVGVKMHRWGVETRGWEPKHVLEIFKYNLTWTFELRVLSDFGQLLRQFER